MSENLSPTPAFKNKDAQASSPAQGTASVDETANDTLATLNSPAEQPANTVEETRPSAEQPTTELVSSFSAENHPDQGYQQPQFDQGAPQQPQFAQGYQQPQFAQGVPQQQGMPTVNVNMVAPPMIVAAKSTAVAYLLWFFLGGLGAHKFYLKQSGMGAAYLVTWLLGLATAVIIIGWFLLGIVFILLIVDAFLIPGQVRDVNSQMARSAYRQY
ncbi:NINE protein [Rothia sp. 88186D007BW]